MVNHMLLNSFAVCALQKSYIMNFLPICTTDYRKHQINPFLDQILIYTRLFIEKDTPHLTSFHVEPSFFCFLKITTGVNFGRLTNFYVWSLLSAFQCKWKGKHDLIVVFYLYRKCLVVFWSIAFHSIFNLRLLLSPNSPSFKERHLELNERP